MFDVVSFGSATLDVFLHCPDARIIKAEEDLIAFPFRKKCEVDELLIGSGGGGTNTAVGFSRLGLKTGVVARCGWDFAGRIVREELKKEKVDDTLLIQKEGEKTDYSTILVGPDGDRTILVYRGGTCLESSLVPWKKLDAKWFYIASLEGNLDLLGKIIAFSTEKQIKVVLNPGKREISQKEDLLRVVKEVDVLILNQEEANQLTDQPETLSRIVVVTKGQEGVELFAQGRVLESDAFKVKMVDATGAGDAFGAGFVAGLIKGMSLEDSLKLGAANGASSVTEIGAKSGLLFAKNIPTWLTKPLPIA